MSISKKLIGSPISININSYHSLSKSESKPTLRKYNFYDKDVMGQYKSNKAEENVQNILL